MKLNKNVIFAAVCLLLASIIFTSNSTNAQTFTDVSTKDSAYEAVEHLASIGVLSTNSKTFNPEGRITRGQMAKMLAIALKLDTKNVKDPKFKDVPKKHEFYPYIAALANKKIISGYADGTFGINKSVTKAHLAKFIVKGFEFPNRLEREKAFEDLKPGTEVYNHANTLYFYGIYYYKKYNPNSNARRNIVATMIYNAMQAKEQIKNGGEVIIPKSGKKEYEFGASEVRVENDGKFDRVHHSFVFLPSTPERGYYLEVTEKKLAVQFEVDETGKMTHLSLVNQVENPYKLNDGVGTRVLEKKDADVAIQSVKFENLFNTELEPVYADKSEVVYRWGSEYQWYADVYAAHGNAVFTDIYKTTVTLSNGEQQVSYARNVLVPDGLSKDENLIVQENLYKMEEEGVFFTSHLFNQFEAYTVEGPSSYKYKFGGSQQDGSYIHSGFYFKDLGVYKVFQNGELVLEVEVFEENGVIFARQVWDTIGFDWWI